MAKPIIPWLGGKRRLAKLILPCFPEHTCYVEPFCGAAALFFMKETSKCEVINDVNGDIVNLFRVVQNHLEEFVKQFKWALVSREIFKWLNVTPVETLTDIQRAARFYYLQKNCFGARVAGRTYGTAATAPPKFNLLRIEEDLSQAHLRLSRVNIEHLDWHQCVKKYDRAGTFFYLDPPYWQTAGYDVEFGEDEYVLLAETLRCIKGRFALSLNEHEDVRKWFDGYIFKQFSLRYTVGGSRNSKHAKELLITNF